MLYKPNFCCNCGEKIERVDWNLLTSRRFCDACAAENKRHDRLPQSAVAGGLLALMFGLGTMFGGSKEQSPPVHTLNSSPALLRSEPAVANPAGQAPANASPASTAVVSPAPETKQSLSTGSETASKFYYCGALTKKGTPCSRKVKVSGSRCFQHEGKPGA